MCENLNQVHGFPFEPLLFSIFTIYARFTSNTKMFESCNILKIFCHHDFSYTRWMIYSSDNFLYGFFKITYQVYMILIDRSTHCRCSVKKSVLRNFPNFTGKPLCWILFWRPLGRQLYQKKTPAELLAEFLRTPILQNICK